MTQKSEATFQLEDLLFSQSTNALMDDLPGSAPVVLSREDEAEAALARGDHDEVRRIVRREAATGNTSVRLRALDRVATARELRASGRTNDALAALRAAIHLDPTCLEAQGALADLERSLRPRLSSAWWRTLLARKEA